MNPLKFVALTLGTILMAVTLAGCFSHGHTAAPTHFGGGSGPTHFGGGGGGSTGHFGHL